MKKARSSLTILMVLFVLTGCTTQKTPTASTLASKPLKTYQDLVVGFAQVGAESIWRSANTADIKEAAKELGVELKFAEAQQKPENQILAIRKFIIEKVDVVKQGKVRRSRLYYLRGRRGKAARLKEMGRTERPSRSTPAQE